tara:strand:- start:1109 stop:1516 length:408 start_codon:yes stop_codon:yes gene_type:complete
MSKKDQNFKKKPDLKIIQPILETFGLDNLEDDRFFTKEHMKEIKTIENMINLHKNLEEYYLPCKSKIYLKDLTEKKCITILRQFVKNYNYKVIGIEKSIKGNKQTTYRLMYVNQDFLSPKKEPEKQRKYIVSFDT